MNQSDDYNESQPKPRALLMTVGVPADPKVDIADALVDEVRMATPEEVVLVASQESAKNARRMQERLKEEGSHAPNVTIVQLESAHDLEEPFLKVNRAIEDLRARGINAEEVAINFTSGTKMMSSGAVLSGVFKRCMELRYVVGAESGSRKRRVIQTHPGAVFALQDIRRARNLALELRFKSALTVLESIDDSLLEDEDRMLHRGLTLISRAYDDWQHFQPNGFLEIFEKVEFTTPLLEPFALAGEELAAVKELAAEYTRGEGGPHSLVDLFNNGLRHLEMGEVDDALIRLYRAMEMLAQVTLKRDYEIDTNNVDVRRIPPRDRVSFEALRSVEDGMVRIGLRKAYDLLIILETPAGEHFRQSEVLREFLEMRTHSILAHGLLPIDVGDPHRVFRAARDLFKVEIERFNEICRQLQFPWISIEKIMATETAL